MIASPCINVCKMDAPSGLCTGCLRTIDEITVWSRVDDARRLGLVVPVLEGEDQSLHVLPGLRGEALTTIGPIPEVEQGFSVPAALS